MDRPKSRLAPALIVAGVLGAVLGAYASAYLSRERTEFFPLNRDMPPMIYRIVATEWEAHLYAPAAWVESLVRGRRVEALVRGQ